MFTGLQRGLMAECGELKEECGELTLCYVWGITFSIYYLRRTVWIGPLTILKSRYETNQYRAGCLSWVKLAQVPTLPPSPPQLCPCHFARVAPSRCLAAPCPGLCNSSRTVRCVEKQMQLSCVASVSQHFG